MSKAYITFEQSESCHDCPCFNDHTGECRAAGKELNTNLEIPEWCPAEELEAGENEEKNE